MGAFVGEKNVDVIKMHVTTIKKLILYAFINMSPYVSAHKSFCLWAIFELYLRRLDVYTTVKIMTPPSNLWVVLCIMIMEHAYKETGGYNKSM
jgi:hypothetical protein